jgi:hypothetical protein
MSAKKFKLVQCYNVSLNKQVGAALNGQKDAKNKLSSSRDGVE